MLAIVGILGTFIDITARLSICVELVAVDTSALERSIFVQAKLLARVRTRTFVIVNAGFSIR